MNGVVASQKPWNRQNPISVEICGLHLESPLVLASGIMGLSASSLKRIADRGVGAVTAKSCGLEERKGHPCPAILPLEHGLLNAVGLANPGIEVMAEEIVQFKSGSKVPIFASIFGKNVDEFVRVTELLLPAAPDLIEINVSCPNVASEFKAAFAADPVECGRITSAVCKCAQHIPVSVKLSLQCPSLKHTAKICEDNGASAITAINSVGPGMHIDIDHRRPVLANLVGGLSGACILPLAVKAVYEIRSAVKIPVIGTGGVESAADALQMMMAGACAVGIGSGLYKCGVGMFEKINSDLRDFLKRESVAGLPDIIGTAHV